MTHSAARRRGLGILGPKNRQDCKIGFNILQTDCCSVGLCYVAHASYSIRAPIWIKQSSGPDESSSEPRSSSNNSLLSP